MEFYFITLKHFISCLQNKGAKIEQETFVVRCKTLFISGILGTRKLHISIVITTPLKPEGVI